MTATAARPEIRWGVGAVVVSALCVACGTGADSAPEDEAPVPVPTVLGPPDGPLGELGPPPEGYRPTAAGAPDTDVWVGTLVRHGTELIVQDLVNATDRPGYDNQPAFSPDGATLYYSAAVDTTQTEVFAYDLDAGTSRRITNTSGASEFSPTPVPERGEITAIREQVGRQHLWRYSLEGRDLGPVFSTVEPVGYHAWADGRMVVMFVLGDSDNPATLQLGDAIDGGFSVVTENPGRSLHRIPGTSSLSFIDKASDEEWWIARLDPATGAFRRMVPTLDGREDYAWTPEGEIVMADGTTLHIWPGQGEWQELQALTELGDAEVSRIAISPTGDRIALVVLAS